MYLHVGGGNAVRAESIVLILDLDTAMTGRDNTEILRRLTSEGKVRDVTVDGLPKSLLLISEKGEESAFLSSLAAATLLKRLKPASIGRDSFIRTNERI